MKNKNIFLIVGICISLLIVMLVYNPTINTKEQKNGEIVQTHIGQHYGRQTKTIHAQTSAFSPLFNQRVLIIGDSQVAGPPGRILQNYILEDGASQFTKNGRAGWGVPRWLNVLSQISRIIQNNQPTVIIIMLGGNDWWMADNPRYSILVQELWQNIIMNSNDKTAICWVGPVRSVGTHGSEIQEKREQISELINDVVGNLHFIRSSDITGINGRTPDGIHFTYTGARTWIHDMMPRIRTCVEQQMVIEYAQ